MQFSIHSLWYLFCIRKSEGTCSSSLETNLTSSSSHDFWARLIFRHVHIKMHIVSIYSLLKIPLLVSALVQVEADIPVE